MLDIYNINSATEFELYAHLLEKSAVTNTSPNMYRIGLDLEYKSVTDLMKQNKILEDVDFIINKNISCIPCVVQLATDSVALVCNLTKMGLPLPPKLIMMLTSPSWIKTGIGLDIDLKYLAAAYNLGHCSGAIDLRNIAILGGIEKPSLVNIYNYSGGIPLPMVDVKHEWLGVLSEDQIKYAAYDAYMSYQIGKYILEPSINALINMETLKFKIHNPPQSTNKLPGVSDYNKNYIGSLNNLASSLKVKYPNYITTTVSEQTQVIINWKECTDKEFVATSKGKTTAKQDAARQMLEHLKSLNF